MFPFASSCTQPRVKSDRNTTANRHLPGTPPHPSIFLIGKISAQRSHWYPLQLFPLRPDRAFSAWVLAPSRKRRRSVGVITELRIFCRRSGHRYPARFGSDRLGISLDRPSKRSSSVSATSLGSSHRCVPRHRPLSIAIRVVRGSAPTLGVLVAEQRREQGAPMGVGAGAPGPRRCIQRRALSGSAGPSAL